MALPLWIAQAIAELRFSIISSLLQADKWSVINFDADSEIPPKDSTANGINSACDWHVGWTIVTSIIH